MIGGQPVIITQWASQASRRRAALAPDYVGIDERTLPELLAFAPSFARHVRFIGADDKQDGNWSDFFMADSAMVLASMSVFDGTDRSSRFHEACRQVQLESADALKFERLKTLFDAVLALASEVDAWHAAAVRLTDSAGAMLHAVLASVISRELAPLLNRLRAYGFGAGQPGALGKSIPVRCHHFQPLWQTRYVCPDGSIYRGHFRRQKINAAIGPLATLHDSFLGAVTDLADRAKHEFASGLANGQHKPHIALYIAFIKQFQVAQNRLNELPARVVDFYYRDLLREPLRGSIPDQMFLSFARAPGTGSVNVFRGTQFPAGTDDAGRPIMFAADHTLNVTQARLMRARATRAIRGPLSDDIETDLSDLAANRLHLVSTNEALVGPNGAFAEGRPWAPFGSADVGTINETAQEATLGFAVSSVFLLLTGGHRTLKVRVRSTALFHQTVLGPLLRHIANATGLDPASTLGRIAAEAFAFSMTTPTGWQEIAASDVSASRTGEDGWTFSFEFELPATAPPLVAPELPPPSDELGHAVHAPTLLARLRQAPVTLAGSIGTVKVYPLSLLDGLPVDEVAIETHVTDLPGATVKSRIGPVDATAPFLPFGTPARTGAWFDIQHRELFIKPLDQLAVSINWLGLPAHPRGFAGYYEQYKVGPDRQAGLPCIANDSFRVLPTLAGEAPWTLSTDNKPVCLFRAKEAPAATSPPGTLDPTTVLKLPAQSRAAPTPPLTSDVALRFTLTDPPFGFGDELYSPNVLYALHFIRPSPPVRRRWFLCRWIDRIFRRQVPTPVPPDLAALYPNPPWQPEIASLALAYDSTIRLDMRGAQAGQFLHLLPSGSLAPATVIDNGVPSLLPNCLQHPQLDLGFTGLGPAQALTLLFRMTAEGSVGDYGGAVTWCAKGADGWVTLGPESVRHDGSDGLRHSGIVSLDLPAMKADADAERLHWIHAVLLSDADSFPAIVAITPHAMTATRLVDTEAGQSSPVPPKTVKAAPLPIVGIATVDQPVASFGGRPAESPATLPIRLGERLRHKERATLDWDYERLVLERFPEISKVRVLAARNVAGSQRPGEVLIVVVPGPGGGHETDVLMPRTSVDTRGRIQAGLQAATSPFVRVHVVDPTYVQVTVRADIVLPADASGREPTRLNEDLCELLSPWSSGLSLPEDAGPCEIRALLANFIATRSYVAGLSTLDLDFKPALNTLKWSVLASAASHDITIVPRGPAPNRSRPQLPGAGGEYAYGL
jgi:hypothetical protein